MFTDGLMTMMRLPVFCVVLMISGCSKPGAVASQAVPPERTTTDLVFLTRDGCANTEVMRANLDAALRALRVPADYTVIDLSAVANDRRAGYGTPTILYRNHDLFGMPEPTGQNPEAT